MIAGIIGRLRQGAMIALDVLPEMEREAKGRQGVRTDIVEIIPLSEFGKSRDQAAALLSVNSHYVTDAKRIFEAAKIANEGVIL
jgi:hypothetical protein